MEWLGITVLLLLLH